MRVRAGFAALACGCIVLAACGGGIPQMSSSASSELATRVAEVRAEIAEGDRDAAEDALHDLRLVVINMVDRAQLTDDKAESILRAAREVDEALVLLSATATTTTTFPIDLDDEGHGKGKGKGKSGKD